MSARPAIQATRKDGTPVRPGDRVLAVWDQGTKSCGRVEKITGAIRISTRGYVNLQTYEIACDDGNTRPAHAWHIKTIFQKRRQTR